MRGVLAVVTIGMAIAGCTSEPAACPDAVRLQADLDAASPGTTVAIGECVVDGPIAVPVGVRLQGVGPGRTIVRLTTSGVGRAVTLSPGEMPTTLADLTVESAGCAGVVGIGPGRVTIERVEVRAGRGVGLAIEGATVVTLRDVSAIGPLTAATIETTPPPLPPFACGSAAIATHGIVLVDVGMAELDATRASGFGAFGVLAIESMLRWTGGGAETNLGAGLEVWGGGAELDGAGITGTGDGAGAIESYGVVFAGGAAVTTLGLNVSDNDGYGLFHDGASASHQRLHAGANGFAGVWAQGTSDFQITGDAGGDSIFDGNGFAGVALLGSSGVTVRDTAVTGTIEAVRVEGVRTIRAADGVHLIDTDAALEGVELTDNARVGVLLDLGGASTSRVALTDVSVEGTGAALGAIAQNGTIEAGWDGSVTRAGMTAANDAMFSDVLAVVGAVGPPCFPPIGDLETAGIGGLVGP